MDRWANNGWLQELPKPQNKMTWDNAAWISPTTAQKLNLNTEDMLELKYQGRTVTAPVWIMPGHANDSVTVHLGFGRSRAGHGQRSRYSTPTCCAHRARRMAALASRSKRWADIIRSPPRSTRKPWKAATWCASRRSKNTKRIRNTSTRGKRSKPLPQYLTLYPDYRYEGYKWGMTIDLNACVGCSACVIACQAENNIPVVGKVEVARGRHMHWIRVDRYFKGNWDNPELYYQPVPCMQCENAPCELVCPVAATVHSGEGLNQMVYNRCVGTRYCSNNCPYKVRRFNFLLYSDWYTRKPQGRAQSECHGAQPRRDGKVHLLHPAHQRRQDRIRKAEPAHRRWRDCARVRPGLPDAGHRVRRHQRSQEPRGATESPGSQLQLARRIEHAAAHHLSGPLAESQPGDREKGQSLKNEKELDLTTKVIDPGPDKIIGPGYDYGTVTDKIANVVLRPIQTTPKQWWISLFIAFCAMQGLLAGVLAVVSKASASGAS